MSKRKVLGICMIVLCAVGALFSGGMLWKKHMEAEKSRMAFEELAGHVSTNEMMDKLGLTESREIDQEVKQTGMILTEQEKETLEWMRAHEIYGEFYEKNSDFVGWIRIDGTNINYPVMQTLDNPDYYLKHNFEHEYSDYGVPYLDEACVLGESNNYVIYGHHMKNGSMFYDLDGYADPEFCKEHPVIRFDTLAGFGKYEVIAVFRFNTERDKFRYDQGVSMTEEEYGQYIEQVHERELYSTGKTAQYGDQLLTLSTCEYTYRNGRLVVVARKVVDDE